ncbi:hypothetical protein L3Q82_016740 [Scortum barcoo]|uniref:Uncharacterized protein n=1 Tax=Scortum barcoo TaxID=214431 RepID=A0ACB8X867_9TELE|nr:hypothetical protein L3Q82_016740 [Scortum barcoo]
MEIFQHLLVEELLHKFEGVVRNYRIYVTIGGEQIEVEANLRNSLWKPRKVSFYLGFTIRGPEAFGIQTKTAEKETKSTISQPYDVSAIMKKIMIFSVIFSLRVSDWYSLFGCFALSSLTATEQHFVDRHQSALITRVSDTGFILDKLMDRMLISAEKYDTVRALQTTEDQMRGILQGLTLAGKDALCEILKKMRSMRPLISELEETEKSLDHGGEKRLRFGQRKYKKGPSGKLKLEPVDSLMDSSDWTELEPVVNTVDEVQTFSLQSEAGGFECSVSALRWVCKEKVSFEYQFCSWDEHMSRPSCKDYMPAGPLLDITVTAGKLEEVHLPHWICVEHNSKISDMFAVRHVDSCGDFVEQVSEVTSSHVKLFQAVFSPRGAMILKKLSFPVKVRYDVLIYKTIKTALTLHVYLVPPDPVLKQAVEREEKSDGSKRIRKPNPDKSLQMENHFFLSTETDSSEISPDKLKLRYEGRSPNFFEVFIRNAKSDFSLKLESEQKKSREKETIWSCTIRTDDYQNRNTDHEQGKIITMHYYFNLAKLIIRLSKCCFNIASFSLTASGQHFVDRHRTALVNRVRETGAILDLLKDRGLISNESYDSVRALNTTQDQMRDILKFVTSAGQRSKDLFYEILKGLRCLQPLISELEGSR